MIALLSLLVPLAHGVAPTDPVVAVGDGPGPLVSLEPSRVFPTNPPVQDAIRRSPRWQRFVRGEGRGWRAIFDEHSAVPRTMWGGGVSVPMERERMVAAVLRFLERNADVVGLVDGELALNAATLYAPTNTWYVQLDELRDGVPVYRGGVGARVVDGNLVLLHVSTTQDRPVTGDWVLSSDDALAVAINEGPAPRAAHTDTAVERRGLERTTLAGREVRRTWMVTSRTSEPPGWWVTFVDAETGELLNVHNQVAFVDGAVEAVHHERDPLSALITGPVPLAPVDSGNGVALTDPMGAFTVADGDTYTTTFDGDYVSLFVSDGPESVLTAGSPDLLWDAQTARQDEIDTYVHLHVVRDWGLRAAPTVGMVTDPLVARVNVGGTCNAFWNGEVNFYPAGNGCTSTGENADVIYHEWGHGFHFTSVLPGGAFSDSISEGVADAVSFFVTKSRFIAPNFSVNGGVLRDVGPDRVYPQDFTPNSGFVHRNGLIFGGAMWDLLVALEADEGLPRGTESAERIFTGLLRGGPTITQVYGEALLADDDDGDLSNGTPHICIIDQELGRHGLVPPTSLDHDPVVEADEGAAIPVEVGLGNISPACSSGPVDTVLHYRVNGGPWNELPMAPGDPATATIPPRDLGDIVEYFVTGDAPGFPLPNVGEDGPYTFAVGEAIELACWDFESDDGGFTNALLAGAVSAGANDWQWGNPAGKAQDPASAHSGDNIWGNDLGNRVGDDNFNGEYQLEKVNALFAPSVSTEGYTDARLVYRRWLTVEDGTDDQAEIIANGVTVWQNAAGSGVDHHIDTDWVQHVVPLGAATDRSAASVTWQLSSDGNRPFGGWNVDDVCVVVPATADNRLSIDDLTAEIRSYTDIRLSWTHPSHAPVERVVLVRNFERFPVDHADGTVLADYALPMLDAEATFDDVNYAFGDSYYAVYAFDGTDWLSWTIEGANAARVDIPGGTAPPGWPDYPGPTGDTGAAPVDTGVAPVDTGAPPNPGPTWDTGTPPVDPPTVPPDPSDLPDEGLLEGLCGCASADPRSGAALMLVLLPLLARRRR